MPRNPRRPVVADAQTIPDLLASFTLSLRATQRSPRTTTLYVGGARRLAAHLATHDRTTAAADVTPDDVRRFILARTDAGLAPNSVSTDYRAVRAFFNWAVAEGVVATDPTAKVRAPVVVPQPVEVFTDAELRALLAACRGATFADRRDEAMLRVLMDCGLRRAELVGLRTEDIDVKAHTALIVRGKGGKARLVGYGDRCALALDRYIRARKAHPKAAEPALWLSRSRPATYGSIHSALARRARKAGVENANLHRFRHSWADRWLKAGGGEIDLATAGGWANLTMIQKVYGRSQQANRALATSHRLGLSDRL